MNLNELLGLPRSGVIVLIKGNSVLVGYTTSIGSELMQLYSQFRGQEGMELRVLSAGADIETLKLHTEYYRNYFKSKGMVQIQEPNRKAIQYKVRVVTTPDIKLVDVELVSARGDSKVVGRFESVDEAKEFIRLYYGSDNPFRLPVYATNARTAKLLKNSKSGLLELK